jgi:ParB-like chromosome segregation protein Spo0J
VGNDLFSLGLIEKAKALFAELDMLNEASKIEAINQIKVALHHHSPFSREPVDCVIWIPVDLVEANDYNPNVVAPPEMRLVQHSVLEDGYTQPVVTWRHNDTGYEVIDGFHRKRIGKECKDIRERVKGYLPITIINADREERSDRIAATIRHNRARGKHQVAAMSEIVVELTKRNWSEQRIAKELGMEPDEVLRLKQITGLAEMFADEEFSEAWEAEQ